MYKFVLFLVLLLSASASVESCAGDGLMCVYEDYCCSGYCNYYITPTTDDFGRCSTPPPNWGHCGFDGDECVKNDDCCSYTCWNYQGNLSYCVPPPRPPVNDIVFAPSATPSSEQSVTPTQSPIETAPAPTPTPTPVPEVEVPDLAPTPSPTQSSPLTKFPIKASPAPARKMKRKHKSRKSMRPKCPTSVAPTPSHHN